MDVGEGLGRRCSGGMVTEEHLDLEYNAMKKSRKFDGNQLLYLEVNFTLDFQFALIDCFHLPSLNPNYSSREYSVLNCSTSACCRQG